jgi:hypothetical protein
MQIIPVILASAMLASAHWTTIVTPPSVSAVPNVNAGPTTTEEQITHGGADWSSNNVEQSSSDLDHSTRNLPGSSAGPANSNEPDGLLSVLTDLLGGGPSSKGLLSGLLGPDDQGLLSSLLGPNGLLAKLLGTSGSEGLLSGLLGGAKGSPAFHDGSEAGILNSLLSILLGPGGLLDLDGVSASPSLTAALRELQREAGIASKLENEPSNSTTPNSSNPNSSSPNPSSPNSSSPNPTSPGAPDLASYNDSSCNSGSKISCCDTSGKTEGFLGNILGGSCDLPQLLFGTFRNQPR